MAQQEHRTRRAKGVDPANAKMTFSQAATLHTQRLKGRVTIKKRTGDYWQETLEALLRSRPELLGTEIRRLTPAACRDWSARCAKTASSSRYNDVLSLLRHVINVAIEKRGCLHESCNRPGPEDRPGQATGIADTGPICGVHHRYARCTPPGYAGLCRLRSGPCLYRLPHLRGRTERMAGLGFCRRGRFLSKASSIGANALALFSTPLGAHGPEISAACLPATPVVQQVTEFMGQRKAVPRGKTVQLVSPAFRCWGKLRLWEAHGYKNRLRRSSLHRLCGQRLQGNGWK